MTIWPYFGWQDSISADHLGHLNLTRLRQEENKLGSGRCLWKWENKFLRKKKTEGNLPRVNQSKKPAKREVSEVKKKKRKRE